MASCQTIRRHPVRSWGKWGPRGTKRPTTLTRRGVTTTPAAVSGPPIRSRKGTRARGHSWPPSGDEQCISNLVAGSSSSKRPHHFPCEKRRYTVIIGRGRRTLHRQLNWCLGKCLSEPTNQPYHAFLLLPADRSDVASQQATTVPRLHLSLQPRPSLAFGSIICAASWSCGLSLWGTLH